MKLVLQLQSTKPGANNKLNVGVILTKDEGIGNYVIATPMMQQGEEVQKHERGNAPFMFIIWENVESTYLNDKDI